MNGKTRNPAIPSIREATALPLVPCPDELADAWKPPPTRAPQLEQNAEPAVSGWPQLLQKLWLMSDAFRRLVWQRHQIADRDDADQLVVVAYGHVAESAVDHQHGGLAIGGVGADRHRVARHPVGDAALDGSLADRPQDVTLGEDPHQTPALGDQDRADAAVGHLVGGLLQRLRRLDGEQRGGHRLLD